MKATSLEVVLVMRAGILDVTASPGRHTSTGGMRSKSWRTIKNNPPWCRRVFLSTLSVHAPLFQSSHVILQRSGPRSHQQSHSVDFAFLLFARKHMKHSSSLHTRCLCSCVPNWSQPALLDIGSRARDDDRCATVCCRPPALVIRSSLRFRSLPASRQTVSDPADGMTDTERLQQTLRVMAETQRAPVTGRDLDAVKWCRRVQMFRSVCLLKSV